jgi:Domain of unknown function (DUF6089)
MKPQNSGKLWILMILLAAVSWPSMAQKREIGFSLGGMYYTGDMARNWVLPNTGFAGMILLRTNINNYLSLRVAYTGGNLKGNDNKPIDAFAVARASSFNIFISEFSGSFEYYFFDYKSKRAVINWSPYFHGGLGIFGMIGQKNKTATYSTVQLAVPLGVGIKFQPDKRWTIGVEFGARILFFDYLDNISEGDVFNKNYQYGNSYDNDNYYYVGITFSKIIYKVYCPTLPLKQGYRRQ